MPRPLRHHQRLCYPRPHKRGEIEWQSQTRAWAQSCHPSRSYPNLMYRKSCGKLGRHARPRSNLTARARQAARHLTLLFHGLWKTQTRVTLTLGERLADAAATVSQERPERLKTTRLNALGRTQTSARGVRQPRTPKNFSPRRHRRRGNVPASRRVAAPRAREQQRDPCDPFPCLSKRAPCSTGRVATRGAEAGAGCPRRPYSPTYDPIPHRRARRRDRRA